MSEPALNVPPKPRARVAPPEEARPDGRTAARSGVSAGWIGEAWAVLVKDLRSELRTRAAVATILLFAVATLLVVSGMVDTRTAGLVQAGVDRPERAKLLSALLWILLFFSGMTGLPRVWLKEEEMRTAAALRLAARPAAVFAGKLAFNALLLLAVAAVVLPLFLLLFAPQVRHWGAFLGLLAAGSVALAGCATLLGAIVARAGGKSYLMLPLALPILLPVLVFTINGTATAMVGKPGNQGVGLVSYTVAMVTLSAMLFEKVWSDA